jgi:hypothetical protein
MKSMDDYGETVSTIARFYILENSDKAKYGSLLTGLQTQQSLGNIQYPKTITEVNSVLSNHQFDSASKSTNRNKNGNDRQNNAPKSDKKSREEAPEMSFAVLSTRRQVLLLWQSKS